MKSYDNLLIETCNLLPQYINKINSDIDDCHFMIETEKSHQDQLIKLLDSLNGFISIVNIIFREKISIQYNQKNLSTLRFLKIHLLSISKGLKIAIKSNDHIMLSDLLQFELKDNLTQWKISAIPLLKQSLRDQASINS